MKVIPTGDLQAANWRRFSTILPNGRNSRLQNICGVIKLCREQALKRKASHVILNGDIFESSDAINPEIFSAIHGEVEANHQAGLETVINLGNHDVFRFDPLVHTLSGFRGIAKVVAEKPVWIGKYPGDGIYIVPYAKREQMLEWFKNSGSGKTPLCPGKKAYLVSHCTVGGAMTGSGHTLDGEFSIKELNPRWYNRILLSDIHHDQAIGRVQYLGSPLQHNFGETHEPGIWYLDTEKDYLEKIPTNFPQFKTLSVETKEDLHCLEGERKDYWKIDTNDELESIVRKTVSKLGLLAEVSTEFEKAFRGESGEMGLETLELDSALVRYVHSRVPENLRRKSLIELGRSFL